MSPQIISFVDEKKKKDKLIEEEIKRSPWYIQAEQKYKKNKFMAISFVLIDLIIIILFLVLKNLL